LLNSHTKIRQAAELEQKKAPNRGDQVPQKRSARMRREGKPTHSGYHHS